ncbi:LVIVD repeat-containing protein [Candidatus Lokiarchaeum ossiferum]|uniref:LVIVD repeat-containing protein n=1 Tax=Candidatus Lokiarchaeum ossiferum TaxID=2951803 RepID=UPI00352DC978
MNQKSKNELSNKFKLSYALLALLVNSILVSMVPLSTQTHNNSGSTPISANDPKIGRFHMYGNAYCVSIDGDYAYLGTDYGFLCISISSHRSPKLIGRYQRDFPVIDINFKEKNAYALGIGGIDCLDLTYRSAPTLISSYAIDGIPYRMEIEDNLAFVITKYGDINTLSIFDISDSSQLTILGEYQTEVDLEALAISGSIAYIVSDEEGLQCIDISNTSNPILLSSWNDFERVKDIEIYESRAYVLDGKLGLFRFDTTDPSHPSLIDISLEENCLSSIDIKNSTIYLTDEDEGMIFFDVSMKEITYNETIEYYGVDQDIEVVDEYAYIASNFGLEIIDLKSIAGPIPIGRYDTDGKITSMQFHDNVTYIGTESGILAINVTNSSIPRFLNKFYTQTEYLAIENNYLISGGNRESLILDESNLFHPEKISELDIEFVEMIKVNNSIAYCVGSISSSYKLRCFDIKNFSAPVLLGSWNTEESCYSIDIEGDIAIIGGKTKIFILNISNPAAPISLGTFLINPEGNRITDIKICQNITFVSPGCKGLLSIDISNPKKPILLDTYDAYNCIHSIYVVNNTIYTADGVQGLQKFDVKNPKKIILEATFELDDAIGIIVTPQFTYAVSEKFGLFIFDSNTLFSGPQINKIPGYAHFPVYTIFGLCFLLIIVQKTNWKKNHPQ